MVCLPNYLKILTLFMCIIGGLIGYLVSNVFLQFFNKRLNYYFLRNFFGSIWYIPIVSTVGIINTPLIIGFNVIKSFDQG